MRSIFITICEYEKNEGVGETERGESKFGMSLEMMMMTSVMIITLLTGPLVPNFLLLFPSLIPFSFFLFLSSLFLSLYIVPYTFHFFLTLTFYLPINMSSSLFLSFSFSSFIFLFLAPFDPILSHLLSLT